jgi:tetratricopeptide (TPR) repeat protein
MSSSLSRRAKYVENRDDRQCVTDETLTEYLEGTLAPPVKAATEVHLVSCEQCRNQLAFFIRVLQPDVTPEEGETLKRIADEWDERYGAIPLPSRKLLHPRVFFLFAAAAAAILIAVLSVSVVGKRGAAPTTAGEVVQLLLKDNRPFESWIAGAPYRPFVETRAPDSSGVSYGLLAAEMTRLSANSHEMGRFYLIQKDFDRAMEYLEIAEREVGAGAAVHNDLGVAYLESGNASHFEKAGQEFVHALQEDSSFTSAAFNLALFYERRNEAALAEAQWKRFLELEPNSDWATEARARLER